MSFLDAIGLGALQGLTEFLPVSSSGHLVAAREVFRIGTVPVLFDVLLHVATLCAVVLVFRNRVWGMLVSIARFVRRINDTTDRENLRLAGVILLATCCTAVLGLAISKLDIQARPRVVFSLFIVTGLFLIATKFFRGGRDYGEIGVKQGLLVGFAQGLGVLPGISRSGITIFAAMAGGLKREKAGEFSFLLSIPAILGALLLESGETEQLIDAVGVGELISGVAASFLVGLLSLLVLLRIIRSGKLYLFSAYLIPLGIAGLLLLPQ